MWALAAFGPRSSIWAGGPSLFGPASTIRSFRVSAGPSSVRRLVGTGGREHPRRLGCGRGRGTAGDGGRRLRPDVRDCANRRRGRTRARFRSVLEPQAGDRAGQRILRIQRRRCPLATDRQSAFGRWPGFKLQWIARHQPEAFARAATLLMPKDYINFRLARRRAWTNLTPPAPIYSTRGPTLGARFSLGSSVSIRSCCHPFNTHRR
jgi:hypothetical protein